MFPFTRIATGVFLLAALPLLAQTPTSNIVGRVLDQTGGTIAGATIRVVHAATGEKREVSSGATGDFTIANLAPGEYRIQVQKEGFKRLDKSGLELEIDQTARLDFELQVGAVAEVVEVTASAPLLNTESAMKGDVVQAREMTDIPLNGRDFGDLAFLVPGVAEKAEGGQGSDFAVNGARADNTGFVVDGFNSTNTPRGGGVQAQPSIDAMMEFKMQTTGYSAEYGRLAGGTMNMALKSGTNRYHGAVFEFLRNEALDARNFFDPNKEKLRRNQFGLVFDGPVRIPKVYNGTDRTFFLFNWESYRQAQASNGIDIVPTALERQGDFSQTALGGRPVALLDPASKGSCAGTAFDCFPGRKIPVSRFDSVAKQVLAYYPLPNRQGVNNFYASVDDPDDWDSFTGKIDHRFSSADSVSFRILRRENRTSTPFNLPSQGDNTGQFGYRENTGNTLLGLTYNRIFSATLINEFRAGLTRTHQDRTHFQQGRDYATEWGLKGFTTDPFLTGFPLFNVTGMVRIGNAANLPLVFTVNNFQWADTLTWVKGRHMMKFGGDILRTQFFQPYYNNNRGTFSFNGRYTGVASPNMSYNPTATPVPFADLLLGLPNQITRSVGSNPNYLFLTSYGFFAQDDFKVTPSLTLNIGVRYELSKPPVEKYGRFSNFIPELGQVVVADARTIPNFEQVIANNRLTGKVVLADAVGLPKTLIYPSYTCFAPRFGFAWRPFGGQRGVIRGGYGIFYGANVWNPVRNGLGNIFPFVVTETFSRNANLTLQNPQGVTPSTNGVATPNGFELHPPTPYMQSWNLTMEREVGRQAAVEIAYTGSKGTHLGRAYNINMPYRLPQYQGTGFPRPYTGYNDITYFGFGFDSRYNAGTITLRKRFARGVFYRMNYVYSKSIDNSSQFSDNSAGGIGAPQNSRDFKAERGRSDWDRGHVFSTMFTYEVPFRKNWLLRDWQLSGTGRFATGRPFTPSVSGAQLDQGEATRPDRTAKGTLDDPTPDMWYDVSAFPLVPASSFRMGNAGRNILDGPGLVSLNLGLIRRIRLGERAVAQFRAEMFNALNHANFNLPNKTVNDPGAGTVTGVADPRLLQFGLRLQF